MLINCQYFSKPVLPYEIQNLYSAGRQKNEDEKIKWKTQNHQANVGLKDSPKQSAFGYHLVHEINRPKGIKGKCPDDVSISPIKRYSG